MSVGDVTVLVGPFCGTCEREDDRDDSLGVDVCFVRSGSLRRLCLRVLEVAPSVAGLSRFLAASCVPTVRLFGTCGGSAGFAVFFAIVARGESTSKACHPGEGRCSDVANFFKVLSQ